MLINGFYLLMLLVMRRSRLGELYYFLGDTLDARILTGLSTVYVPLLDLQETSLVVLRYSRSLHLSLHRSTDGYLRARLRRSSPRGR